ncbi:hypothetical protein R9C00_11165 [Flammeovirgaceae bacterium SG7u.111]|nr:hypothetical protein [Flammeovirgaceae bacterium SG7u.132]WPO38011.1 hypothetical protein R9C00_11165 [Flammeovirgaceae bacterium SG7u.111]
MSHFLSIISNGKMAYGNKGSCGVAFSSSVILDLPRLALATCSYPFGAAPAIPTGAYALSMFFCYGIQHPYNRTIPAPQPL